MRALTFLLTLLPLLAGCATSKPITGPSGKRAYFVKCPAAAIDKCYEEASRVCPSGYTLADKGSNSPGVVVPVGGIFVAGRGPNTMLVECR